MATLLATDLRQQLRLLNRRSDLRGLLQLGSHLGALTLTAALIAASRPSSPSLSALLTLLLALWLHGTVLVFLFAAAHESIHRTAFRQRWLNDATAFAAGLLLLLPPRYFRLFHYAHHQHTQDPQRDPELAGPKPDGVGAYLYYVSGLPYWRERLITLWRHATGRVFEPFITPSARAGLICEARCFLAIYLFIILISLIFQTTIALYYWLLPALLGQPLLRLFLLAEHTDCPLSNDPFANTRTTLSLPPIRWLSWNMPYHAEHHAFAALPFYALPRAHRLLRNRLQVCLPGYVAVHRQLLSRRRR